MNRGNPIYLNREAHYFSIHLYQGQAVAGLSALRALVVRAVLVVRVPRDRRAVLARLRAVLLHALAAVPVRVALLAARLVRARVRGRRSGGGLVRGARRGHAGRGLVGDRITPQDLCFCER